MREGPWMISKDKKLFGIETLDINIKKKKLKPTTHNTLAHNTEKALF